MGEGIGEIGNIEIRRKDKKRRFREEK